VAFKNAQCILDQVLINVPGYEDNARAVIITWPRIKLYSCRHCPYFL